MMGRVADAGVRDFTAPDLAKLGQNGNVQNTNQNQKGAMPKVNGEEQKTAGRYDTYECQTCKNRKYQDGSDDMGVSFKNPTKIDAKLAAQEVRGHEMEHVYRNRAKAEREGREVVSQRVVMHRAICEECGKPYVSGGTTYTVTKAKNDKNEFAVAFNSGDDQTGKILDTAV